MTNREPPPFSRPPLPAAPMPVDQASVHPSRAGARQQPGHLQAAHPQGPGSGHAPGHAPGPGRKRRRRGTPPPQRGRGPGNRSVLGWIGLSLLMFIIAVGAGIGILLMTISPTEIVREQLASRVKAETGRDLVLGGGAGLTFWPKIGVSLKDVTLSAPPGMQAPPTLKARNISVRLALWPLLSGKAVVESVALDGPQFDLRRDRNGKTSWTFARLIPADGSPRLVRFAQARTSQTDAGIPSRPAGSDNMEMLERIELSDVQVSDGTVVYTDEIAGTVETVRAIDANLKGRTIRDPLQLIGSAHARGTRFNFDARVNEPRQLLLGKGDDVSLTVTSAPVRLSVSGKANPFGSKLFSGPVDIRVPNVDGVSRLAGLTLPRAQALGAARVAGRLDVTQTDINLLQANLGLGDTTVTGAVSLNVAGSRPLVTAELSANQLNVDAIVAGFRDMAPVPIPGTGAANPGYARPQSIDELLRRNGSAPKVKGFTARDGWSQEPIDVSALQIVDVNARVRSGPILTSGLRFDNALVRIGVKRGAARVNLDRVALYKGQLKGIVTLAPNAGGAKLGANLNGTSLALRPLLLALAEFGDLDGTGNVQLTLSGVGRHQHALMSSLRGSAKLDLENGAIIGWNIAELMRGLQRGDLSGLNKRPNQRTDFSSMNATFNISQGVAVNKDLRLNAPLLRVSGAGNVDIGKRRVNYLAKPKLVASLSGQGAAGTERGFEVPVRIRGAWAAPKFEPELGDVVQGVVGQVLEDPSKLQEQARQLRRQFKGKKAGEVVEQLLGNDGRGAKDLLRGIFGGQ